MVEYTNSERKSEQFCDEMQRGVTNCLFSGGECEKGVGHFGSLTGSMDCTVTKENARPVRMSFAAVNASSLVFEKFENTFAVIPAHGKLGTVSQNDGVIAAEHRVKLLYAVDVYDGRTVNT
jgi:hypothetical protein